MRVLPDVSFPAPNILQLFVRMGTKKPTRFGVMDLTQGYHQAPSTFATRAFTTASITFCEVHRFTRLPFELKLAPSYFQEMMATIVFSGLIYHTGEMYTDDSVVYGNTDGEFVSRLRSIFERFRLHNLFLKVSKCKFGHSELDFVGKVISEEGLQMSRTRIQSALDFLVPVYAKQLKSFLGTMNYFRDFIRNQSSKVHLLRALIADHHETRKYSGVRKLQSI